MRLRSFLIAMFALLAAPAMTGEAGAAPTAPAPLGDTASLVTPVHGGIYWRYGHPYWNGYRGYYGRRPGYRYYGGYWFPYSAFSFGIIIGPPVYRDYYLPPAHFWWCERRYRSYRRWDNSFQPYHGPRRACVSPYMR